MAALSPPRHDHLQLYNPGNTHNLKLYTKELRQEAYKDYCSHIAAGRSKKSWVFNHPEICLTWETMEKYIKNYAAEFDPELKKVAEALSLRHWEEVLTSAAEGKNKDANVAAIQMMMRNKFNWDRKDVIQDGADERFMTAQQTLLGQIVRLQLPGVQEQPQQIESIDPHLLDNKV